MGCLPSIVAYGAILNAVDEEFEKIVSSSMDTTETKDHSIPQLEDYQRHYRRYSLNTCPAPSTMRDQFLEAWKEEFLVVVYNATESVLSPDSQDIFHVREILLEAGSPSLAASASSSTDGLQTDAANKIKIKRSPRSPRSVVFPNPRMLRGGSFF